MNTQVHKNADTAGKAAANEAVARHGTAVAAPGFSLTGSEMPMQEDQSDPSIPPNTYQLMADASPQVKQLYNYQAMADAHAATVQRKPELSSPGTVIQRRLVIGADEKADLTGADAHSAAIGAILQGWIAAGDRTFVNWATAIAMAWLDSQDFKGAITILDPVLSAGNCHGYTFGGGGANSLVVDTAGQAIARWDQATPVVVCMTGNAVGHTARLVGGAYHQTLPGGPTFSTSLAYLQAKYTCYSLPGDLAALTQVSLTPNADEIMGFQVDLSRIQDAGIDGAGALKQKLYDIEDGVSQETIIDVAAEIRAFIAANPVADDAEGAPAEGDGDDSGGEADE